MKKGNTSNSNREKGCRELAVEILLKVERRNAYADILLDHSLKSVSLPQRDRALLTQLIYGTLRWRGRIDWVLSLSLHRALSRTDPYLRNLLRLILYQILFLDKVPEYAAVHEGVEMAKRYGGTRAGGLVNGVVRKFLREKSGLKYPEPQDDDAHSLSILGSHPEWLVKRWLDYFGREETEALLMANNEEAPLTLRVNSLKGNRANLLGKLRRMGFNAGPTPWAPQGIQLKSASAVAQIPGFQEGLFQIQGEASQLVSYLVNPRPGERVLDACAAPGGKTTHLAELMEDKGEIIATDISTRGLDKLEQNVQRLGLTSVRSFPANVTGKLPKPLSMPYDRILVDAPCSGLGTLRSHPEAKWHRDERDIQRLSKQQKKLVHDLSTRLKPKGILVYATCTLTREENEEVVENFLDQNKGFVLEDARDHLPDKLRHIVHGKYFLSLPHRHDTDGFFAARMRKVA